MIDATAPIEYHETAKPKSINEIINHYWRQLCIQQGIDPDNPPPSTKDDDIIIKCEQGPHGEFRAVAYKTRAIKFIPLDFLNEDSVSEALYPYRTYAYDNELLTSILKQMDDDGIEVVVLPAIGQDVTLFAQVLKEALEQGQFGFTHVIFADESQENCDRVKEIVNIIVAQKSPFDIAQSGANQGIKIGMLQK